MNNAEMRSRLTLLGLSLNQLATITGWDYRELRRMANGKRPVSDRTAHMIERFEEMADSALLQMQASLNDGEPIVIPHFSDTGQPPSMSGMEDMPGSYWHALAGSILATHEAATVVYPDLED